MNVQQILAMKPTTTVETIAASARVSEAARLLSARKIGALVVSSGDVPVAGILSERDIVRHLGETGAACLERRVSDLMTEKVVTAKPEESAVSVLERMTAGRFRHMPVMQDGRLVGVISIGDVVKARIAEMEFENREMATMLAG